MGYMQDADKWLDALINELFEEPERAPEVKRSIRAKLLESYRNGLKAAGQSPVPTGGSARRFPTRAK